MTQWRRIERPSPGPLMTALIVVLSLTTLLCFTMAVVVAHWD